MQNNNLAGVRTFLGLTVFGSAKQQCGRRSNFCWGQQFSEVQNSNVAGVRTFVGGQQFLEVQNSNVAGVRSFVGGQQFLEM